MLPLARRFMCDLSLMACIRSTMICRAAHRFVECLYLPISCLMNCLNHVRTSLSSDIFPVLSHSNGFTVLRSKASFAVSSTNSCEWFSTFLLHNPLSTCPARIPLPVYPPLRPCLPPKVPPKSDLSLLKRYSNRLWSLIRCLDKKVQRS